MTDISRRTFIQLSVVSTAAAAGLTGCKNEEIWKEEATGQYGGASNKIYPYVNQPDGTIDGVPAYYASTCQMCSAGCGIYVRTLGGRANKIEGNPYHPVSGGKSCLRGQLALQHLYNPDRLMHPMVRPNKSESLKESNWDDALLLASTKLRAARNKVAVLVDGATVARSPSKMASIESFCATLNGSLTGFSLIDDSPWVAASQAVYGKVQLPDYRLDQADLILSFGGNFLEAWPSPVYYGRHFGEFRQGARRTPGSHGEFIYVGPRLSMTAAKADQWVPCKAGTESIVASAVVSALGGAGIDPNTAAELAGVTISQIFEIAAKVRASGQRTVAIGGDGLYSAANITQAFVDVERINVAANSTCVRFGSALRAAPTIASGLRQVSRLIGAMDRGDIDALVFIGETNPSFILPQSMGWNSAAARVPFIMSIGSFLNESSSEADIALSVRTFLEEWGDFVPSVLPSDYKGASMTQPVIDPAFITRRHDVDSHGRPVPLMDTREMSDILSDLTNRVGGTPNTQAPRDRLRSEWAAIGGSTPREQDPNNDTIWTETVSSGGMWIPEQSKPAAGFVRAPGLGAASTDESRFQLMLFPHIYYDDGRHANLNWAQEMPDPLSSSVWNSWVEINMDVAHSLNIRTGDIVRLQTAGGSIEVPAVPFPGIHPRTIAMPIGQGHTNYGRNASGVGSNPLSILDPVTDPDTGALAFSATTVTLSKVRSAQSGFHSEMNTLVLVQDRPHGEEPAAVKDLIHETAKEWKSGPAKAAAESQRSRPVL